MSENNMTKMQNEALAENELKCYPSAKYFYTDIAIIIFLIVVSIIVIIVNFQIFEISKLLFEKKYLFIFFLLLSPIVTIIQIISWSSRLYQMGKLLYKDKPVLVLTKDKLIDNFNEIEIPWDDIQSAERYRSGAYALIRLKKTQNLLYGFKGEIEIPVYRTLPREHYDIEEKMARFIKLNEVKTNSG